MNPSSDPSNLPAPVTEDPSASMVQAAQALRIPFVRSLSAYPTSADFVQRIPIGFARQHEIMGFAGEPGTSAESAGAGLSKNLGKILVVALADVMKWDQLDVVSRLLGHPVRPVLSTPAAIGAAINEAYQQRTGQAQAVIQSLDRRDVLEEVRQMAGREDLLDVASRAPVIKLVNLMLFEAVKALASDVHVQPHEDKLVIRLRLDGVLYDSFDLPKSVQEEIISRVKVMGKMNIAEKRLPQDGRATVQVGDRTIDLRIASLPTSHGERAVIRLLDKSARLYRLGELGMDSRTHKQFKTLIGLEHGLLLVTGPTGSGKTTTLYSALQEIDATQKNVLTLEDPIEYQLDGISQTQISEKKGMTFASGLRNVLRQDPDVIMVGEIRDRETATMAIQSALTGHLVFSTLHTNDAASAVTRLLDLGIEPYLLASSLVGVLAQRLVRRVCPDCGRPHEASAEDRHWLGIPSRTRIESMRDGTGCDACRNTGYRGRLGIFELLVINNAVRRLVQSRATAADLKTTATGAGMQTLRDDGIRKVLAGLTTITEVERVTMRATGSEDAIDEVEPETPLGASPDVLPQVGLLEKP